MLKLAFRRIAIWFMVWLFDGMSIKEQQQAMKLLRRRLHENKRWL